MKNHIGYLEFTAFKRWPRQYAGQKKRFPTKNPPIATFLRITHALDNQRRGHSSSAKGCNLPEFVVRAVSGLGGCRLGGEA